MKATKQGICSMVFIAIWSLTMVEGKTSKCNPEDNKNYHSQADTCLQCEICLKGDEVIFIEKSSVRNWNPKTGRTCRGLRTCHKCRPFECRFCRNFDRWETVSCTFVKDIVCEGNLPPTKSREIHPGPKPMKTEEQQSAENKLVEMTRIISSLLLLCFTFIIMSVMVMLHLHKGTSFICNNTGNTLCSETMNKNPQQISCQEKSPASDEDSNYGENFAKKVRRWSYPFEMDYFIHKAPIQHSAKESNIDVTANLKNTKNDTELTEKDLWKASRYLVPNKLYIKVARELGLPEVDIQIVEMDFRKESMTEIAYQTLLQLRKKKRRIMRDTFKMAIIQHDQEAWNNIISCQ